MSEPTSSPSKLARLVSRPELLLMFGAALVLQLLLAPPFGFVSDLHLFEEWASRLAAAGPGDFYDSFDYRVDYPPGYLYVLWLLGEISSPPSYLLLKLPTIVADLGLAWIAGTFAARLAPASLKRRYPVDALVMAAVLFNPAILFAGPFWGQVDSVPALFALACLLLLFTGKPGPRTEIPALLLYAVAIAMKPQCGFMLPVILYALYRRHLRGRSLRGAISGAFAVAVAGVLSLGLWAASGIPFGFGPIALVKFYKHTADMHSHTSANAFNLWGVIAFFRDDLWGDRVLYIYDIPAQRVGMLLFIGGTYLVLRRTHESIARGAGEAVSLTLAAATVTLLAFTVLTKMHERYMFTAVVLFAPLIIVRPLRWAYAGLSALFLVNLWYAYTRYNIRSDDENVVTLYPGQLFDWLFGDPAGRDTWQKKTWSLAVVAVTVVIVALGPRWVERWSSRGLDPPDRADPVEGAVE